MMVITLLFIAYGIKLVEWAEESDSRLFGITIYQNRKIKQQYKIFGLIPISSISTIKSPISSILENLDPDMALPTIKMAIASYFFWRITKLQERATVTPALDH